VTYRDRAADELAAAWWSIKWDADALIQKHKLTTPDLASPGWRTPARGPCGPMSVNASSTTSRG
jgi:hypothetical protein